jgi:hypothetical protein
MTPDEQNLRSFRDILSKKKITLQFSEGKFTFSGGGKKISMEIASDLVVSSANKLASIISSRLQLNEKVFARNCEVKRIEKKIAEKFLNEYHLMNSADCAFAYGLFFKEEILAVCTFSKGRKMDRLPAHKRSYELIRFCCTNGITVTGGLSKIVKTFCKEKEAGDVMTYIDPDFSLGGSYLKAGFRRIENASEAKNKHNNIKLVYTI